MKFLTRDYIVIVLIVLILVFVLRNRRVIQYERKTKLGNEKSNKKIVLYYEDWCGHSRNMLPEWSKLEKENIIDIETYYIFEARLNNIETQIKENETTINNNQECIESGFNLLQTDLDRFNDDFYGIETAPETENLMLRNKMNDLINQYTDNPDLLSKMIENSKHHQEKKENNNTAQKCFNIV